MGFASFIITVLLICMYLLPSIIAAKKKKSNMTAIALLNILLGWSLIGWVVALVWANTNDRK